MKVEKYILELLKKHECVVIPNFGAFIAQRVAAAHFPIEHKFYPPTKHVSFNKLLQSNDGMLIQYIATQTKSSYNEVQVELNILIQEWNDLLENNQTIFLKAIGKIYKNLDNTIHFVPDITDNLDLSSYGLLPTKHLPINRITEKSVLKKSALIENVVIKKSNNLKLESERRNKNRKRKFASSIIASIIIGIAFLQLFFFFDAPFSINEANFISFVSNSNTNNTAPIGSIIGNTKIMLPPLLKEEVIIQTTVNPTSSNDIIASNNVTQIPSATKEAYYIILGCFKEVNNADKLVAKISREGNTPYRRVNQNGSILVGMFASSNAIEAQSMLQQQLQQQPDAWLKHNK
ncbi:MAG: SPOR domain-containing protein [Bacteroidota bacterium]